MPWQPVLGWEVYNISHTSNYDGSKKHLSSEIYLGQDVARECDVWGVWHHQHVGSLRVCGGCDVWGVWHHWHVGCVRVCGGCDVWGVWHHWHVGSVRVGSVASLACGECEMCGQYEGVRAEFELDNR